MDKNTRVIIGMIFGAVAMNLGILTSIVIINPYVLMFIYIIIVGMIIAVVHYVFGGNKNG